MNPVTLNNAGEAARVVKHGEHLPGPSSVRRSGTIGKLAVALAKAQGELKNPPKDSVNPHFKSRYADLATVRDTVMPVFSRNGLSVLQLPCEMDGQPALTTVLMHGESGEFWESTILLRGKLDPQGVGSALTYHRRYTLQALAGVAADDDDDGNAASVPHQKAAPYPPAPKPAPVPPAPSKPSDNPALRAKRSGEIGALKDRADCDALAQVIKSEGETGKLSPADLDILRPMLKQAYDRFPAK